MGKEGNGRLHDHSSSTRGTLEDNKPSQTDEAEIRRGGYISLVCDTLFWILEDCRLEESAAIWRERKYGNAVLFQAFKDDCRFP